MQRVLILVEGQTEETFVRDLLTPHLTALGVYPTPVLVETKRAASGLKYKGGVSNYRKIKRDAQRLLNDSGVVVVTTMLDFCGLPHDFPGQAKARKYDARS